MRNAICRLVALILLPLSAAAVAQEHDQVALLQSSSWSGTMTWMTDGVEEQISAEFDASTGQLRMLTSGSRESCLATLLLMQRLRNGTFVLAPEVPSSCSAPVKVLSLSRTSETEIGFLMMSESDGLSQGRLAMDNPTEEQLEDRETLRRPLPTSLAGFYHVSESGLLLQLERDERSGPGGEVVAYRIVVPDAFAEEQGLKPGDPYGQGYYLPLLGELTMEEPAVYDPELASMVAHCPQLLMPAIAFDIANARRAERGDSTVPMLAVRAKGERYCSVIGRNPKTCRIAQCLEYKPVEGKKSMLLEDETLARELARVSRAAYTPEETYAEVLEDLRSRAAMRKTTRRQSGDGEYKGYFDRGGACGNLSCEEEDTLQFIVDQYW